MDRMYTLAFLLLVISSNCDGSIWQDVKVQDPLVSSALCDVYEPVSISHGDTVSPHLIHTVFLDRKSIWYCSESGYSGFIDAFDLDDASLKAVSKLSLQKNRVLSTAELVNQTASIYAARLLDDEQRKHIYPILAFWLDRTGQPVEAALYMHRYVLLFEGASLADLEDSERSMLLVRLAYFSFRTRMCDSGHRYYRRFSGEIEGGTWSRSQYKKLDDWILEARLMSKCKLPSC